MNTPRPLPGPEIYAGIEALGLPDDCQGWHSDHAIFGKLIAETNQGSGIIECGSWKGASAIHMARLSHKPEPTWKEMCDVTFSTDRHVPRIYCIDTWLGGIDHELHQEVATSVLPRDSHGYPRMYHQFLHNVAKAGFQHRIVPIPQTSINGARLLQAHKIVADLIYIDGSHFGMDPYEDMRAYWPLLRKGGVMFGDDLGHPGVMASFFRFVVEAGLSGREEVVDDNFWIIRKP